MGTCEPLMTSMSHEESTANRRNLPITWETYRKTGGKMKKHEQMKIPRGDSKLDEYDKPKEDPGVCEAASGL
jgi:hypothetical protein